MDVDGVVPEPEGIEVVENRRLFLGPAGLTPDAPAGGGLCVAGIDNLLAAGMLITSDHRAHMSTRNTVSCMGQGQAVGTAAALCAKRNCGTRDLPYGVLRKTLEKANVYFEG